MPKGNNLKTSGSNVVANEEEARGKRQEARNEECLFFHLKFKG